MYRIAILAAIAAVVPISHGASPELAEAVKQREAKGLTATVLCDLDFDGISFDDLRPKWVVHKGKYAVVNGVLHGEELPSDKHLATAGMDLPLGQHALAYFEVELQ